MCLTLFYFCFRIAIGLKDGTSKVWDLSKPHLQYITMTNLWQKMQSRILTLAWHLSNDVLLAYGTYEGRVSTNITLCICALYHLTSVDASWKSYVILFFIKFCFLLIITLFLIKWSLNIHITTKYTLIVGKQDNLHIYVLSFLVLKKSI